MSDAKTPAAASNATHEAFASAFRSGARPFENEPAAADWSTAGAIEYPSDPAAADAMAAEIEQLSREFSSHVKVPGRGSGRDFKPEPLKLAEHPRPGGPRLDPRHLPAQKKSPQALAQIEHWKEQGRTRCAEPGCYHPVTPKRLERLSFEPILFKSSDGGAVIAGECAYEPRHAGGLQWIPKPKEKA